MTNSFDEVFRWFLLDDFGSLRNSGDFQLGRGHADANEGDDANPPKCTVVARFGEMTGETKAAVLQQE